MTKSLTKENFKSGGHDIDLNFVGFFKRAEHPTAVDFSMSPEVMLTLYQLAKNTEQQPANDWWNRQGLQSLKTKDWLDINDIRTQLSISDIIGAENSLLEKQFARITTAGNRAVPIDESLREAAPEITMWAEKQTRNIRVARGGSVSLRFCNKRTANDATPIPCIHISSLEQIERLLGRDSGHSGAGTNQTLNR